jgi:putative endonuclease
MYYVYILSNKYNNVLYTGVTNDIIRRVYEHKNKFVDGFTYKYNVNKLVYYDMVESIESAISIEKQIKGWSKQKKIVLVESLNPKWDDLYYALIE